MVSKIVLFVAQAIFLKSIAVQAIALGAGPCSRMSGGAGYGLAGPAFGYAAPTAALAASNGPGLIVSSSSPLAPIGISVSSENIIEGNVAVAGALPFLGTVGLEGVLPTVGAGNVAYNCGSGAVAITAEDIAAAPLGYAAAGPLGYGLGIGEALYPFGYAAAPFGCGSAAEIISPFAYATPFNYASPLNYDASPLNYASPISYAEHIGLAAGPLRYSTQLSGTVLNSAPRPRVPLGRGAGPISYSAGILGFGAGPYNFGGYEFI